MTYKQTIELVLHSLWSVYVVSLEPFGFTFILMMLERLRLKDALCSRNSLGLIC